MSTVPVARRDLLALVLAATCWGVGTVISKAALDEVPPMTLLPVQLAVSLVILGVLMRRQGISFRSEGSPLLGRLGLLNPGAAYALSLLGLATITASLSVLLWALEPLMILFLAGWFLHERITLSFIVLSLIAVGGVVVILYDPAASTGQVIGVVSAAGSGALYYAGAYWFYLGALRHVPASYAALSFYLIPIVGVTAGALLLGERLDPRQWVGAVIVLAAILLIIRQPAVGSGATSREALT